MGDVLKQSVPTPAEYLIQRACHWRTVERALISDKNPRTTSDHHNARKDLRQAVDRFMSSGDHS